MTGKVSLWTVERHGGPRDGGWRELYRGNDAGAARAAYEHACQFMKRGTIVRLYLDGTRAAETIA